MAIYYMIWFQIGRWSWVTFVWGFGDTSPTSWSISPSILLWLHTPYTMGDSKPPTNAKIYLLMPCSSFRRLLPFCTYHMPTICSVVWYSYIFLAAASNQPDQPKQLNVCEPWCIPFYHPLKRYKGNYMLLVIMFYVCWFKENHMTDLGSISNLLNPLANPFMFILGIVDTCLSL